MWKDGHIDLMNVFLIKKLMIPQVMNNGKPDNQMDKRMYGQTD